MATQQRAARKQSRSKRDRQQEAESGSDKNGHEEEATTYEQELAGYLQERIKPGLNRGAIPLLARSIAKEIAHREHPNGAADDADVEDKHEDAADREPDAEVDDEYDVEPQGEAEDEYDDEPEGEAEDEYDDEPEGEADDEYDDEPDGEADDDEPEGEADDDEPSAEGKAPPDLEADMRELQAELGEDWILRFSVQGDDAWLTAEKDDGSQHVEAPTASVLLEVVERLEDGGDRAN